MTYIRNRRDLLENYLPDGRCSFSNNASERAVKQVVIDRKNWLFAVVPSGAEANALIYIMVEMHGRME
ncbi:IS66 family transposase [Bacillota bacterium HCP3S3_E9]